MLYTPIILTNMDIVDYLYRRGNVILVKLCIGSIWELFIGPTNILSLRREDTQIRQYIKCTGCH